MNDIFGVKVVRSNKGYHHQRFPKPGEFRYAVRFADFERKMATIEKQAIVNFCKYIFTKEPIEWIEQDPENNYIQIHDDKSYTKERNLV